MDSYSIFGLHIASDIRLPTDEHNHAPVDATITLNTTPRNLPHIATQTSWYELNDTQCLFHIDGVARYFIEHGTTIIVEPHLQATYDAIRLWLLGSAMGALLYQRGILPIHASAVQTPTGAILIAGETGMGKSTTAAGLVERGYRLMSDDVCPITVDAAGTAWVAPAYPRQKLCEDAVEHLGLDASDLERLPHYEDKLVLPRIDHFCDTPQPVRAVYVLAGHRDAITLEPVRGMAKLQVLQDHIYRPFFMPQKRTPHLTTLATLAAQASVTNVYRPAEGFTLPVLLDVMQRDFG